MIDLIDVGKYYPTEFGKHWVFRNVTLSLSFDKSVAVIGPNGAGKSTFLRLLAGADIPSEGRILRHGHISPPMGLTPTLQANLSGSENARFAGRIYGLNRDDIDDMIDDVRATADIGKYFDLPVSTYSAGMRQRVAFSINMSLHFDFYLFDEISAGGDREFRKFSKAKVKERLQTSKFIVASHHYDELLDLCDAAIVIQNGELQYFEDIQEALSVYDVDSDTEEDDPKTRRRARRKAREERPPPDGQIAATGETLSDAADQAHGPRDAERAALRERRLAKLRGLAERHEESDQAVAAATETGMTSAGSAESVDDMARRQRIRELRKQLRTLRQTEAGDSPAEAGERPGTSALQTHVASPVDATPDASRPPGAPDAAEQERRTLKRQQVAERREKRRTKSAAPMPESEPHRAAEPLLAGGDGTGTDAHPGDTSLNPAKGSRHTARRQRRLASDRASAAPAAPIEVDGTAAAAAIPADAQASLANHAAADDMATPSSQPEDPQRPAETLMEPIQRLRDLARTLEGGHGRSPTTTTISGSPAASGTEEHSTPSRRATIQQERAQAKAARALRLLLQHLDETAANGPAPVASRRINLIAAAQESAAAEAAKARSLINTGGVATAQSSPQHPVMAPRRPREARRAQHDSRIS